MRVGKSTTRVPPKDAIHDLLGTQTLADIAPLPDDWRAKETATSHPKTELWHFTDVPTDKAAFDEDRDCPKIAGNEPPARIPQIRPKSIALSTARVRSRTPSLESRLEMWFLTVPSVRLRRSAISRLL